MCIRDSRRPAIVERRLNRDAMIELGGMDDAARLGPHLAPVLIAGHLLRTDVALRPGVVRSVERWRARILRRAVVRDRRIRARVSCIDTVARTTAQIVIDE